MSVHCAWCEVDCPNSGNKLVSESPHLAHFAPILLGLVHPIPSSAAVVEVEPVVPGARLLRAWGRAAAPGPVAALPVAVCLAPRFADGRLVLIWAGV